MAVRNVSSGKSFVAACRAPSATMFFTIALPRSTAISVKGTPKTCTPAWNGGGFFTTELSYRMVPPTGTSGANFARLGALNATRIAGCGEAGDRTSSALTCTSAYDVPPRDSGP